MLTRAIVYGESVSAYAALCASASELAGEVIAVVVGDAAAAAQVSELASTCGTCRMTAPAYWTSTGRWWLMWLPARMRDSCC